MHILLISKNTEIFFALKTFKRSWNSETVSDKHLLAKIGVDTAENGPKVKV